MKNTVPFFVRFDFLDRFIMIVFHRIGRVSAILARHSFQNNFTLPRTRRLFSSLSRDPSLDELEAMLNPNVIQDESSSRVMEVISDEIVKIPIIDKVAIGTKISISTPAGSVTGFVLHFNSKHATVGLVGQNRGSVSRASAVSIAESLQLVRRFKINRVPFALNDDCPIILPTLESHIPVIDMLFSEYSKAGQTVAIYSPVFKIANQSASNTIYFPSSSGQSAMEMYMDLINCVNKAIVRCEKELVKFIVDFRNFEDACKSLEFQAACPLPSPPQSMVASVLQLSHARNHANGISVIALFNSKTDFGYEASRSVDIDIELGEQNEITNLSQLLSRFSLKKYQSTMQERLARRLVEGLNASKELKERQEVGLFVDFWDIEESECISSLIKLLPFAAKKYTTASFSEQQIILRALSTMFFNKTSRRHAAAIERFPDQLIDVFHREESDLVQSLNKELNDDLLHALDAALMKHRYRFELTNPLVAL